MGVRGVEVRGVEVGGEREVKAGVVSGGGVEGE